MKIEKEPQSNPAENPEPNIVHSETKRPGSAVPEDTLWQPRVEIGKDGQNTEKGIVAPDGTYYELQEGEKFVINRQKNGDYEAVVIGPNGEKRFLRKSLAREKAESEQSDKEKLADARKSLEQEQSEINVDSEQVNLLKKLDRNLLKKMVEETTGKGILYGRGFNLDSNKREQLETVAQIIKKSLESKKQDSRWTKLQELMEEGSRRGILMDSNLSGFHPSWLVDGGKDIAVQKIKRVDGKACIQVPSEIYNLYYWDKRADSLIEDTRRSDDGLKGTSTESLNKTLIELSGFFKESGLI